MSDQQVCQTLRRPRASIVGTALQEIVSHIRMKREKLLETLSQKRWQEILRLVDSSLCLFLLFPSMVFYWRGIWDLYAVYIGTHLSLEHQMWSVTGFGGCSILGYFAAPLVSHLLTFTQSKVIYVLTTRLYLYAYGILAMAYWRGVWGLADFYLLKLGWTVALAGFLVSHGFLLVLRCSRTTIFTPFVVNLDTRKEVLGVSTCFRTEVKWREPTSVVRYLLDSMFTQYFILTLTIISWRSSLCLLDIFLFPDDWWLSNVVSLGAGVAGSIVLHALETPLSRFNAYIQKHCSWFRLIYEDLFYLVVFAFVSLIWRGAWNLNVLYIFTDPMVGGWVNISVGSVLLLSLQVMSYGGSCGCSYDGRDADARAAIFPSKYLRAFLQRPTQEAAISDVTSGISNDEEASIEEKKEEELSSVAMTTIADVINGRNENPAFRLDEESSAVVAHI